MLNYNSLVKNLGDGWDIVYDRKHTRTGFIQTKLKLPSGMTAEFGCDLLEENFVWVEFVVYRKRKNGWPVDPNETTGKDGLLPAMWALERLNQIETALRGIEGTSLICLTWNNKRLKTIYERVLGNRGYYLQQYSTGMYLVKKIND